MPRRKTRTKHVPGRAEPRCDGPQERRTLDTLFSATYEELRLLASGLKRTDANETLSPMTRVNEACLKLATTSGVPQSFDLTFEHGRARRSCRVTWRTADKLGVAFDNAEQAAGFAHDPALQAGMAQAGVEGAPRIEIFTDV